MRKVLSIDGGGIRGIVPALLLDQLELRTGKRVSELFDLIAGTSTGGLLALGLTNPDDDGQPLYSARDLVGLYERYGKVIFHRDKWRNWLPFGNLFGEKYDVSGVSTVLHHFFRDSRLREATTNVLITAYDTERRMPFFFRSTRACNDSAYDFPMKDAARATSAAPTYFEPVRLQGSGLQSYYSLIDGGVFANNPAMCAYVEAQQMFPGEDILLISLGTGTLTRPIFHDACRHWGVAKWAKPVLDITFDGVSSTVDYQLRRLLPKDRYYRLQPTLYPSLEAMDNTAPVNLRGLCLLAEGYMQENQGLQEEIVQGVAPGTCPADDAPFPCLLRANT